MQEGESEHLCHTGKEYTVSACRCCKLIASGHRAGEQVQLLLLLCITPVFYHYHTSFFFGLLFVSLVEGFCCPPSPISSTFLLKTKMNINPTKMNKIH